MTQPISGNDPHPVDEDPEACIGDPVPDPWAVDDQDDEQPGGEG